MALIIVSSLIGTLFCQMESMSDDFRKYFNYD
jgi:hypothetical protein